MPSNSPQISFPGIASKILQHPGPRGELREIGRPDHIGFGRINHSADAYRHRSSPVERVLETIQPGEREPAKSPVEHPVHRSTATGPDPRVGQATEAHALVADQGGRASVRGLPGHRGHHRGDLETAICK